MLKRIGAEEGGEFKAVASGTLPSGRPVIVNADGTVSVVVQTALFLKLCFGNAVVFEKELQTTYTSVYDSIINKLLLRILKAQVLEREGYCRNRKWQIIL